MDPLLAFKTPVQETPTGGFRVGDFFGYVKTGSDIYYICNSNFYKCNSVEVMEITAYKLTLGRY
jgi:hypothetical protein